MNSNLKLNKQNVIELLSIESLDKTGQIHYFHTKASPYFLVGLQAAPVAAFFIHGDLYARNAEKESHGLY